MRLKRLPLLVAALGIIAVALVIAACGGAATPTSAPPPTSTTAPVPTTTPEDASGGEAATPTSPPFQTSDPAPDATPEGTSGEEAATPALQPVETPIPAPAATPEDTSGREAATPTSTPMPTATADPVPTATPGDTPGGEAVTPTPLPTATPIPAPAATPDVELTGRIGGKVGDQAPEFRQITNWINSDPLTMEGLRGKVVLIDFWTYTCVNCIRTLPYITDWHSKYADKGLVIVGVHSPEFEFEKVTENVAKSSQEYGLEYPIAQDNSFGTWRSYSNRYWPAKYLVDQNGIVRYSHFGEGAYGETEQRIRQLLEETGADLSDVDGTTQAPPQRDSRAYVRDPATRITREIYGGYNRNNSPRGLYVGQNEYYEGANRTVSYQDPGDYQNQLFYLQGPWYNGHEALRHARQTEGFEDYIALKFFATSVNVVVDSHTGDPFQVNVTLNGRPLMDGEAGPDIVIKDGQSFFEVDEGRMYEIVALPEFGSHELKLSSTSDDFTFFAFTFGAYEEGP